MANNSIFKGLPPGLFPIQDDGSLSPLDLNGPRPIADDAEAMRTPTAVPPMTEMDGPELTQNNVNSITAAATADVSPPENLIQPEAPASTPKYDSIAPGEILDLYRQLKGAQSKKTNQLSSLGMLQGGNQIAQAFASGSGAKIGDGSEAVNMLMKNAGRPVDEIREQISDATTAAKAATSMEALAQEQKMADPSSDISGFMRKQAVEVMGKLNPKMTPEEKAQLEEKFSHMSALDLQKLGFKGMGSAGAGNTTPFSPTDSVDIDSGRKLNINRMDGRFYYADTGQMAPPNVRTARDVARKDALTDQYGLFNVGMGGLIVPGKKDVSPGTDAQGNRESLKFSDYIKQAPGQQKDWASLRDKFIADTKDARETATSVTTLSNKLKTGKSADQSDIDSGMLGSIQTQAAKMAGQKGVLTDQDLKKFGGAGGWVAAATRAINNATGKMSPEDIEFFRTFDEKMSTSLAQDITNRSKYYVDQGRQLAEAINPNAQDSDIAKWLSVDKVAPAVQDSELKLKASGKTKATTSPEQSVTTPDEDTEAVKWAKKNPKDPRAQKILQHHGM